MVDSQRDDEFSDAKDIIDIRPDVMEARPEMPDATDASIPIISSSPSTIACHASLSMTLLISGKLCDLEMDPILRTDAVKSLIRLEPI